MRAPPLSVIMSVHNDAPFLRAAVESVRAQTFADFEFLIVDDGSTDGSAAILDRAAASDPRIRVITQENRGLIASLNRLVAEARAPLLARMDGDDICLPDRFARQLDFMRAHPDHGVVGTWATCIDSNDRPIGNCGERPETHEGMIANLRDGPLFCHPSVIMRRDLVEAVGGYHAAYRYAEDYDLWLRLSTCTRFHNLTERLILYRHSDGQVSTRHHVRQLINAAISWEAHLEREAGRTDPTDRLAELPGLDGVDALFGRPSVAAAIRERVVRAILYSPAALRGDGYDLLIDHVSRDGKGAGGLWRTAGRLVKMGEPARALRLAAALTFAKAA